MGCDIHFFTEAKQSENHWICTDKEETNPYYDPEHVDCLEKPFTYKKLYRRRNYNLFCALCGVRSSSFIGNPPFISEPRGLPENVSDSVQKESDAWGSDGHSHNWNTLKELKEFDWSQYGDTCDDVQKIIIPFLESQGLPDEDVRIVYWFDN